MFSLHDPDNLPTNKLRFVRNIIVKALLLFLAINLVFVLTNPLPVLGRFSAYNHLFPGRKRLPYGENPQRSYNLSLYNLEAMVASHELDGTAKAEDEYRVIIIGDSSTWGFLLQPNETFTSVINDAGISLTDGRHLKAYNLGYPVMSLAKDLLILSFAMRYQPDLVIWPLTLESFPYDKQLFAPILQNNPSLVQQLAQTYHLSLTPQKTFQTGEPFWKRTLIAARRDLADLIRLQLYGALWAATGIDQDIPEEFTPRMEDLPADLAFHNLQPPDLREEDLAFEVLDVGLKMAGKTPILFINEPMFISQGQNSDIRYNYYYPRWAYDGYRTLLTEKCRTNGWNCIDLWDAIPPTEFTNTAVHMTPEGNRIFAQEIIRVILNSILSEN